MRDKDEVIQSWDEFIHTHHYSYHTCFFASTLGKFPRRTCEATFDRLMNCIWLEPGKGFKEGMGFQDLDKATYGLIMDEYAKKGTGCMLCNPYVK